MPKKKKPRLPGLVKKLHPKTRWDCIDHDYIDKLSDEEKEWLSTFNEEYLGGNFSHPGKKLHRTKKARRDCYNRNNARYRDVFTRSRATGFLMLESEVSWSQALETKQSEQQNPGSVEDALIDLIEGEPKKR